MRPSLAYCRSSIPGLTLHDQIRFAEKAGVAIGLDLRESDFFPLSLKKDLPPKTILCPTVIAYDTHGQNLISDASTRKRFMPYFRNIVRAAVRCRSRGILVALYEKKSVSDEDGMKFFKNLARLVPRDIKILLESLNRQRTSFHPSADSLMMFQRHLSPRRFGLAVDTWHMHESEKNLYQALAKVIPFVDSIHLKDTQSRPPGQGSLDWDRIKRIITDANYAGDLMVECAPFKSKLAFRRHVIFMKALLGCQ